MFKKFLVRRKAIAPGVIIKPTAKIRPVAERVTTTVKEIIESTKFTDVNYKNIFNGIVAIHCATKAVNAE